jgi:hypothetical protein
MVTDRAVTNDITQYNQSVSPVFRPYPFPDALVGIVEVFDKGSTTNIADPLNWSYSFSGSAAILTLPGFRGVCQATRIWMFSMGPNIALPNNPATGIPYSPTVVIPAVGTITIQGGSKSQSVSDTTSFPVNITESVSNTGKVQYIPPVLTLAYTVPAKVGPSSGDVAQFTVMLPSSIISDAGSAPRAGWQQGDIITEIQPIEKLRANGVYLTTVWLIVVPYTTGQSPNGFTYAKSPASYPTGTSISTNSPTIVGGTGFSISPSLPSGLSFNTSTGDITGNPSAVTSQTYTISCTKSGLIYTAYLTIITYAP